MIDFSVSIEPRVGPNGGNILGRWRANSKGKRRITLYLGQIWREALPYDCVDERGTWDVERFTEELILIIVIESICVTRYGQKLRIKNRCTPCKVYPIAQAMVTITRYGGGGPGRSRKKKR